MLNGKIITLFVSSHVAVSGWWVYFFVLKDKSENFAVVPALSTVIFLALCIIEIIIHWER